MFAGKPSSPRSRNAAVLLLLSGMICWLACSNNFGSIANAKPLLPSPAALAGPDLVCGPASSLIASPILAAGAAASGSSGSHDVSIGPISPDLTELDALGGHARAAKTMLILFEVAVLLAAAKTFGWAAERIRVPGVIGELLAGVVVGPYVLGQFINVPLVGHWVPLFPAPLTPDQWPINSVVWTMAQFASIILLFITGLHTDLQQFLRYLRPASLIAVVGLVVPFLLGVAVTGIGPFAAVAGGGPDESALIPALFVGAILAATSIGITARVLGDIGKLDTPEGVTILGAAVLDDVLGIIALAIVGGIASSEQGTGGISVGSVVLIAVKAFGFWIALTVAVLLLARRIEWVLRRMNYSGAMVGIALAIALLGSAASEGFGLAFIIGAYSVGLGLSRTKIARELMEQLDPIGHFFVPIFFASLGMLVNLKAMFASPMVVWFGLSVTAVAIVGKLAGCGLAALPVGFNWRGGYRIGLGMMPRGEVALIVAGIGLSQKIIGEVVFGVSIMMTLITTLLAPILLVPAFARGGSGRKPDQGEQDEPRSSPEHPGLPTGPMHPAFRVAIAKELVKPFVDRLLDRAASAGWQPSYGQAERDIYLLRNAGEAALVTVNGPTINIDVSGSRQGEFVSFAETVRQTIEQDAAAVVIDSQTPHVDSK